MMAEREGIAHQTNSYIVFRRSSVGMPQNNDRALAWGPYGDAEARLVIDALK